MLLGGQCGNLRFWKIFHRMHPAHVQSHPRIAKKLLGTDRACGAISSLLQSRLSPWEFDDSHEICDFVASPFISIQLCSDSKLLDDRWPAKARAAVTRLPRFCTCKRDKPATPQRDQLGSTRSNLCEERLGLVYVSYLLWTKELLKGKCRAPWKNVAVSNLRISTLN